MSKHDNTNQQEPQFLASENPHPVLRVDNKARLLYANPAAHVLIQAWKIECQRSLPTPYAKIVTDVLTNQDTQEIELSIGQHTFLLRFMPMNYRQQVDIYAVDVTPRKTLQNEVIRLTHYDDLTGLVKREQFMREIDALLAEHALALLRIDIDGFRALSDSVGQTAMDALLKSIADRLATCIPAGYPLARLTEDEFAVIYPDIVEHSDAANLAQVILDNIAQPFAVADQDIHITACIGIALSDAEKHSSEQLLQHAGIALSHIQHKQCNKYNFYQHHMRAITEARHSLLKDLRHSLQERQILLYYQPQVDLVHEEIVGAEALVRWQHPKHGLVTPGRFTQLAEGSGFIIPLGYWILEHAVQQLKIWQGKHSAEMTMAVNVSPLQLQDNHFIDNVKKILNHAEILPQFLELEIVESILIDNKNAKKLLFALADLGVKIVIDDFGTGYSSLNYLSDLPIYKIKIDRHFVNSPRKEERAILDTILRLGRELNLLVVAEGIENYSQLNYLIEHGCIYGQGYYFSEPLPAHNLETLL